MNALQQRTDVVRLESDLATRLEALFLRCPELHGFTVQPGESLSHDRVAIGLQEDLYLADVIWHRVLNGEQAATLVGEISLALLELVDEQPGAVALLRGRTFASVLH
jgi:hypothetical protein